MWYLNLEEKIKHRATLRKCERCGLFFKKQLDRCPHCSQLDDEALLRQIARRSNYRVNLGRGMLIGAIALVLIMLLML